MSCTYLAHVYWKSAVGEVVSEFRKPVDEGFHKVVLCAETMQMVPSTRAQRWSVRGVFGPVGWWLGVLAYGCGAKQAPGAQRGQANHDDCGNG